MNKSIFLLFTFFSVISSGSLSWSDETASDCGQKIAQLGPSPLTAAYSEAYSSHDLYRPEQCGLNVKKLIVFLRSREVNLSRARVLFMKTENSPVKAGLPVRVLFIQATAEVTLMIGSSMWY